MASIVFSQGASLFAIEFDATLSEQPTQTAMVTSHPVERGQPLTDFVKPDTLKLSLVGFVTDSPLNDTWIDRAKALPVGRVMFGDAPLTITTQRYRQAKYAQVSGAHPNPLPGGFRVPFYSRRFTPGKATPGQTVPETVTVAANARTADLDVERVKIVWKTLLELIAAAEPVTVVTSLKEYPNMVVSSVSAPQSSPQNAVSFEIELTEVRYADTRVVGFTKLNAAPKPAEKRNEAEKVDVGAPLDSLGSEDTELKSWMASSSDALPGFFGRPPP